ncbi:predicted protein [Aspergillus terreus NIH2624]|uniref:Uncharacterized protein n=1 Tax=Aspergillus terreus (strain NIH 2624 / FGSC A1156) TaxID=341663 RepID=Q0C969_ASPTN|nr:uncharacterized protein ATEG_09765 [Aspergillus terreus NIH2624]EAU29956.1 predicted protein [Aspergillus terreus NIH2624]
MSKKKSKNKAKAGSDLKKQIRAMIDSAYKQNKQIDRKAIKARFLAEHPNKQQSINDIVNTYSDHLESKGKKDGKKQVSTPAVKQSPPSRKAAGVSLKSSSALNTTPTTDQHSGPSRVGSIQPQEANGDLKDLIDFSSDDERDSFTITHTDSDEGYGQSEQLENVILKEFKEHLAVQDGDLPETPSTTSSTMPSLEDQLQFLNTDPTEEGPPRDAPRNLEHAILVTPSAENLGHRMPSQSALLGQLDTRESKAVSDPRVMLNANIPFSAFICGLQGSGKSHTTSCIIENCSLTFPALGNLKKAVSTLVLNFNEYSSNISSQPSEAAFLASIMPQYASRQQPIPVRVLVSPTNFHNLGRMYSQIPNVEVRPFQLQPRHLNISMMLSLMSMGKNDSMPLYMAQVIRVLREMAIESGGHFDYAKFRARLDSLRLDRAQTPFLYQRLDLLDSYLDLSGRNDKDYFIDGGVTILDLSCPFVDANTACILFRIAIDLFLYSHSARGKMIVADEAHKVPAIYV